MIDTFKKVFLAGLGASVATKEKIEASLNDLVEKGRISKDEAEEAASKIVDEGKAEFESAKGDFNSFIEGMMERGNFASIKRVEALEARLAAVEAQLAEHAASPDAHDASAPDTAS